MVSVSHPDDDEPDDCEEVEPEVDGDPNSQPHQLSSSEPEPDEPDPLDDPPELVVPGAGV